MRPVDTIHYFPPHIKSIEEFQRIAKAYDKELRLLWQILGTQVKNQYFDTMDEATCTRWENIVGIKLSGDENLFERRINIKGKWISSLPYTKRKIREVLNSMLGDNYDLTINVQRKTIHIDIKLAEVTKVDAILELMRSMAPADMDITVQIIYNRWQRFIGLTWDELWNHGADTWGDVKQNTKWQ